MAHDESAECYYSVLADSLRGTATLIDVGCGRGAHLAAAGHADTYRSFRRRDGGRIIGIDVAIPAGGNPHVDELRPIGPASRWPVDDNEADVATADWVLEHVDDPDRFFGECARVLRPGGVFIARTMQVASVAGVGARIVPDRWHTALISRLQPGMQQEDIFPTRLRCNSRRAVRAAATTHGLELTTYTTFATLNGYGAARPALERLLQGFEALLPRSMWHAVVLVLEKR